MSAGSKGLDLSNMRIVFRTHQFDAETPNTCEVRVYNLSDATALTVQREFQTVTLQAGYASGNYGIIFQGTIKQFKKGRENAMDSYLDIYASDADQALNFGVCSSSVAAGSTVQQRANAIVAPMNQYLSAPGISIPAAAGTGGILPRGKVLFGLSVYRMTELMNTAGLTWSVQNGRVVPIPLPSYLPGDAVVLNARSGLIGVPEATDNGIEARCLLNPAIKIGQRIQINNAAINQLQVNSQSYPKYSDLTFPAQVTNDGFYRALVVEHEGDSRGGNPWWTSITCLALDSSSGTVTTGN